MSRCTAPTTIPPSVPRPETAGAPWPRSYRWQEPLQQRSVAAMLRVLSPRPDESVLDLGAGTGMVTRALHGAGVRRVAALEPSVGMLSAADYAGRSTVRADALRLPVGDATADVVVASWLLHVLSPDARAAAVAEAARVLRPGGRFGLIVPAAPRTSAQQLVRVVARGLADLRGLGAFHVPADLPGLLTDSGLQVRHHTRTGRGYLADVVVCTRAGVRSRHDGTAPDGTAPDGTAPDGTPGGGA